MFKTHEDKGPPPLKSLSFNDLKQANFIRCIQSYHSLEEWTPTDWACAMAGESGEACNFVKKLKRIIDNKKIGKRKRAAEVKRLITEIGKELADLVIYADLLATRLNLNLGEQVRNKFNDVSHSLKSPIVVGEFAMPNGKHSKYKQPNFVFPIFEI